MNATSRLFRLLLGSRLARTAGTLSVTGLRGPVLVRRDAYGIPCIEAEDDDDAWFGFGFCQGQDRGFQLEALVRAARGTLAEVAGRDALPVDRLARRLGFRRAAAGQLDVVGDDVRALLESFARGINAGTTVGARRRPHELALLRTGPSSFEAVDVLAISKLVGFALSANWDVELARLRVLTLDGPDALRDVNPTYLEWHAVTDPPGARAGPALDRLAGDVLAFKARVGAGGGSNNWALAPARTASGRALMASDPHLEPVLPNHWYLGHVRTPRWAIAGAALAGTPAIVVGHNDRVAWGVTAGMVDDTDLFVEEVGPDGASLRQGDDFVPCEKRVERIAVRGGEAVEEDVIVGPRGPIVGSAIETSPWVVSLRATWMPPRPVGGFLRAHRARSCDELRALMSEWPGPSLNLVCADVDGAIAWQLIGDAPQRRRGFGTLPGAGWAPNAGWEDDPVPFEAMPGASNPPEGFIASANNNPRRDGAGPYLGIDWVDGYRVTRLAQALDARSDWDLDGCASLQCDDHSLPWEEMRPLVLPSATGSEDAEQARALLAAWDGRVRANSPAATVFELFVADMCRRAISARAPRAAQWALGRGSTALSSISALAVRHVGLLVRLLRSQPQGWLGRPWEEEVRAALEGAVQTLRAHHGDDPRRWAWGEVRPLTLKHAFGARPPLGRVFDLGPFPWGGDANTVAQASSAPLDPTGRPLFVPTLRAVMDVGAWDEARFCLAGGQSGNPMSPHYSDMVPRWRDNDGIAMAWSPGARARATVAALVLEPKP